MGAGVQKRDSSKTWLRSVPTPQAASWDRVEPDCPAGSA